MALVQGADQTLAVRINTFPNDLAVVDSSKYNRQELKTVRGLAHADHDKDNYTKGGGSVLGNVPSNTPLGRSIRLRFMNYRKISVVEAPVFPGIYQRLNAECCGIVRTTDKESIATRSIDGASAVSSTPFVLYEVLFGRLFALLERFHALAMQPWLRRNAHGVFTKTSVAAHFREERGYEDVRVLPVGLDQSPFEQRMDRDWHREPGLPNDALLLAYVGELEPRRRPDLLVDVLSQLDSRFHLIEVGDGSDSSRLLDAASKRIPERLFSVGWLLLSELPSIYEKSHALQLSIKFEIYGMVLLEAKSFGLHSMVSFEAGPAQAANDARFSQLIDGVDPAIGVSVINLLTEAELSTNVIENTDHHRANARVRCNWEQIELDWLRQL